MNAVSHGSESANAPPVRLVAADRVIAAARGHDVSAANKGTRRRSKRRPLGITSGIIRLSQLQIGQLVATGRQSAFLSQEELARLMGVSRQYIAKIEAGQASLPAEAPLCWPERMRDIYRGGYSVLLEMRPSESRLPLRDQLELVMERLGEVTRGVREAEQSGTLKEKAPELLRKSTAMRELLNLFEQTVQAATLPKEAP